MISYIPEYKRLCSQKDNEVENNKNALNSFLRREM